MTRIQTGCVLCDKNTEKTNGIQRQYSTVSNYLDHHKVQRCLGEDQVWEGQAPCCYFCPSNSSGLGSDGLFLKLLELFLPHYTR